MGKQYRWSHATESAELDGMWVVMNAEQSTITKLSGVGGYIWSALREPATSEDLVAGIISDYEVTPDTAQADTERFLRDLLDIGVVEQVS